MKKIIALIFAFCFVGNAVLLAGGKEDEQIIQRKYLSGRMYFRQGNYELAVKQFSTIVRMDPNYKVASEYLKAAEARLQAEKAFKEKKRILEEGAKEKGKGKLKSEREIKDAWKRWLAKEEEKKRAKQEKKEENARLKREKELAHYYKLDEMEKISQNAQEMIARAGEKKTLKEEKESKKWAKVENLSSPKKEKAMARIYMARASAAYKDGDYNKAIKEWEKVNSLDPVNTQAPKHIEKVRRIIERNKQAELEKLRRESISDAKEAVEKYCKRASYLYGHKDYKASIELFQKALAIDANCKEAQQGLLKAQRHLRAEALKKDKAGQKIAYKVSKLVSKGNKYLVEKKFLKAKKIALKVLDLNPDSGAAKRLLEKAEKGLVQ